MNILFISHYSSSGGANNELLWLAQELKQRGHTIFVALPDPGTFEEKLLENNICYKCFGYLRWICGKNEKTKGKMLLRKAHIFFNNHLAVNRIMSFISDNHIDIIHTNDSLTCIGVYAAYRLNIPHVWHLREFLEEDYNRSIIYSDKYIAKCFARSSAMVAISHAVLNKYDKYITKNNIVRIYDGIPVDNRHFVMHTDANTPIKLLYTGGTNNEKGFDEVIRIAEMLKNQYELDFNIIIAGNCDQRKEYEESITKAGVKDNMDFVGFVNDIRSYQESSDIFLMTSVLEAFGLVTVEAMLAGAIVVGRATGGTKEIIKDGETGFLYEDGDYQRACEIIFSIAKKRVDVIDVRKKAYNRAVEYFSIDRVASEVENLYLAIS